MKKLLLLTLMSVLSLFAFSQTAVYHENFEVPTAGDSVVSTGTPIWALNTTYFHSGVQSFKTQVGPANADTSWLTTNSFSTLGNSNVILSFWHICKIEFFDFAIVQVSNDNGLTWNKLTATQKIGDTSNFAAQGSRFCSATYGIWASANPTATPTNSWWRFESFDLSTFAANASQVKIRFKLYNGAGGVIGPNSNYGWVIDDIKVNAAASELIPPTITYVNPLYLGSVYSLGPFTIKAKIADASGIQSGKLFYKINSGLLDSILMTTFNVDTMQAIVPVVADLDTVKYYIRAIDNSPAHNMALNPTTGFRTFVASSGIHFPYVDNLEGASSIWTASTTSPGTNWELGTPTYGTTNSAHSPVKAWDVNLTTVYTSNANCSLTSSVFDFSSAVNAKLSFWINYNVESNWDGTRIDYTTNGTTWQVLGSVGDPNAVNWYNIASINSSSLAGWTGSSNGWIKAEYTLTQLNNIVGPVQFRFVFDSDGSGEVAGASIDDISITLPSPQDAGVTAVLQPDANTCAASGNSSVQVVLKNFGTGNVVGPFNIAYKVDGGAPVIESYIGTIIPATIDTFTFATPANLTAGAHILKCYTILPSDGLGLNDTTTITVNAYAPLALPYINPLDAPINLADFCVSTGAQGRVQQNAAALNTGAGGIIMDATTYTGWTITPDTIFGSPSYVWDPTVNSSHLANAKLIVNSATYSNLILKFDMKMLYLYSNNYTNFRVLVNGTQITPHFMPNGVASDYTTYEYSLAPFLPAASLNIEFQSKVEYPYNYSSPNGNGIFLDNVKIYEPPTQEAAVTAMSSPNGGCGLGNEIVKISIKNTGSDTINGGLTATYKILGGATITPENITATILPNQIYEYTFATPANLGVTTTDSTFGIKAWVNLVGDPLQYNDSIQKSIYSGHTPIAPISSNTTIPYGTTATLTATAADTVFWYNSPTSTNQLAVGSTYTSPYLYANTVYYAEASIFTPGVNTIIGTGTAAQYYVPCNGWYNYSWGAMLYTASELNFTGSIDTIAFYVSNAATLAMLNQSIYMLETTDASFANANKPDPTTMTQVFTGNINWTGPGWFKIALQTPFNHSGSNNLMVYWENFDGSYASGYPNFNASTTTGNLAKHNYSDAGFPTTAGSLTTSRANILLIHTAKGCSSTRVADTVFITGFPALDAGVKSFVTPISTINLTNAEVVSVKIMNFGTSPISNFPVSYKINGLPAVTETVTSTINSGDSLVYAFAATADFSVIGNYNCTAYTSLVGDNIFPNDTIHSIITNQDYCASAALYTYDDDITNVTFAGINNTSIAPFTATYTDYTSLPAGNVSPGGSYPISINVMTYSGYLEVYIDYNRDGVFTEPGEVAFGSAYSGTQTLTGTIDVPVSTLVGSTRMRIVQVESGTAASVVPCGTYNYGETEDYKINVFPMIPNDAGVTSILNPTSTEGQGSSIPVTVVVKNFGTDPITAMDINYTVNGGTAVVYNWTGNLAPAAIDTVILSNITVGAGNNTICAYTVLVGDSNQLNDQMCKAFFGIPTVPLSYFDNFDGGSSLWYEASASPGSNWQNGVPNYGVTNSAHSAPNAWDVNLTSGYGSSANTVLYSPMFQFNNYNNVKLSFWRNHYTEAAYDGTRLEYTMDGGATWLVLGSMGDPNAVNWYTIASIYSSSLPAWSGASSGWVKSEYSLVPMNGYTGLVQFRFVFTSDPSVEYDGFSIDDFTLAKPFEIDGGVSAFITPNPPVVSGSTANVTVSITNYGLDTLTSIPLKYRINNGTPVSENWNGTLLPGNSVSHLFSTPFAIPATNFTLESYTDILLDSVRYNDTTKFNMYPEPPSSVYYTTDFESPTPFTTPGTLWQHGIPTSSLINTAHSPDSCWKTSLAGNYGNSVTEYLYTQKFNFSQTTGAIMRFWHWINSEAGKDGGNVQYSTNNGTTWINLGYYSATTPDTNGTNWYNNATAAMVPLFDGTSSGWQYSSYNLHQFDHFASLVQFRFKFFSDATGVNTNGWAIDDFTITVAKLAKDAGVKVINNPTNVTYIGAPVTVNVKIKNFGLDTLTSIPVTYKINNNPAVNATWTGTLLPDSTVNYSFSTPYSSPAIPYNFASYSKLTLDTYLFNDTTKLHIVPVLAPLDAGVPQIIQPAGTSSAGSPTTVIIKIKNYGADTLHSIPVQYKVNAFTAVSETWTGTLLPGDSVNYTFTTPFNSPISTYVLCSKTILPSDAIITNDEKCTNIAVGIETFDKNSLYLMQNIPNPTNGITLINYNLPTEGKVNFKITNLLGQNIYSFSKNEMMGNHKVEFNTSNLSKGIYYYSLQFNGKLLVKKMVIN
ncbi:MAG: T9SS type A sorting domain-containing protein [Bacteroidetes bacterium]|nr:T9SS type A sorting domain-containing protein [Bacteroidota bacterium]